MVLLFPLDPFIGTLQPLSNEKIMFKENNRYILPILQYPLTQTPFLWFLVTMAPLSLYDLTNPNLRKLFQPKINKKYDQSHLTNPLSVI